MAWLRQTFAVMLHQPADDSFAAGFLRRCHYRNCRRRDRVRVGAVDICWIFRRDDGNRVRRSRADHAGGRGHGDDQRCRQEPKSASSRKRLEFVTTADTPLASAELSVVIDLPKKSKPDWTANVPMRGIPAGNSEGAPRNVD